MGSEYFTDPVEREACSDDEAEDKARDVIIGVPMLAGPQPGSWNRYIQADREAQEKAQIKVS